VRYADDRVDRTGARAEIAADAERLVDTRNPLHARVAEAGIERARIAAEELGERTNRRLAPGRAAVDVCVAFEDRLGIRPTPRIAALRALYPRQEPLDALDRVVGPFGQQTRGRDQRRREREREAGEKRECGEHTERAGRKLGSDPDSFGQSRA